LALAIASGKIQLYKFDKPIFLFSDLAYISEASHIFSIIKMNKKTGTV